MEKAARNEKLLKMAFEQGKRQNNVSRVYMAPRRHSAAKSHTCRTSDKWGIMQPVSTARATPKPGGGTLKTPYRARKCKRPRRGRPSSQRPAPAPEAGARSRSASAPKSAPEGERSPMETWGRCGQAAATMARERDSRGTGEKRRKKPTTEARRDWRGGCRPDRRTRAVWADGGRIDGSAAPHAGH